MLNHLLSLLRGRDTSKAKTTTTGSTGVTKDVIRCLALGFRVHVLFGESVGDCMDSMYFKEATSVISLDGTEKEKYGDGEGYALSVTPSLAILCFDKSTLSYGCIAHEVFHVLWRTFRHKGMPTHLDYLSDELYAYSLGNLVDEVVDIAETRGLEISTVEKLRKQPRYSYQM